MTNNQFDLQAALKTLHANDWLNPVAPVSEYADEIEAVADFNVMDSKYMQRNFWIAQFAHLLTRQFELGPRAISRVLKLNSHKVVVRAMATYPTCEYASLREIQDDLAMYCEKAGLI
ncbi:MAG: hypothetical protein ACRC9Z_02575 [Weissella confusa]